ncbi:MAG: TetR/AcrR family transcriptional regulator [Pseudonocardiaceae bacterium]
MGQCDDDRGRKRGRPRSAGADRAILQATLTLLAEHGYAGMSIDAVAREAGVSKPTIYLRYPGGKSELATAALADLRNRNDITHTGDTRTDLIAELRRFQRGVERPFGMAMIGTVLAEEHHHPELLARFREHVVAPRRRLLRGVLEQARERGELVPGADLDRAVTMLVGSYYAGYLAGEEIPADWPEQTVDTLLPCLQRPRRARQ